MRARSIAENVGYDPRATARALRGLRAYRSNRREFRRQAAESRGEFRTASSYPCLGDRFQPGGVARGQYFHQDLLVAQAVYEAEPERHVDVGSRIDGFVAHVASFRRIEVVDIRPLTTSATNIHFIQADVMRDEVILHEPVDSLSCLHTLEHLGLGRYGDRVDYYGFRRGWDNLSSMVRRDGLFYFSTPIGHDQRVEFDAHRVFSLPYLLDSLIRQKFLVESFAYVDDDGELHRDVDCESPVAAATFGLHHGCGIFTLRKR